MLKNSLLLLLSVYIQKNKRKPFPESVLPSLGKVGNTALCLENIKEWIQNCFYIRKYLMRFLFQRICYTQIHDKGMFMLFLCHHTWACNPSVHVMFFVVLHFRLVVYIFTHLENVQKDMPTNTQLERKILSKNEGFVIILVKLFFFHICYHSWKPITEVTYFGATGIFRSTHHELMWRKKCGIIGESFFLNVHFLRKNLECSKYKQYLSYCQNGSFLDNYSPESI